MLKEVLVVGPGGREHALAWSLAKSPQTKIYIAPGNAGTAGVGENISIGASDITQLANFASRKRCSLTVVGPEVPLAEGIVNEFQERNLPIFGPTKEASQIESSKVWARHFMKRHGIPGPKFATFDDYDDASAFLEHWKNPSVVVKADGLCAGKGVFVCDSEQEAQVALYDIMVRKEFGSAGDQVVIEERLYGKEASVLAITDGETILPLLPAEDYKPVFDGDKGPNTGGMGGVCPHWEVIDPHMVKEVTDKILMPAVEGMAAEGKPYQGILYAGLMVTKEGPKVLEFNCRFGDPETQLILPLLQTPLFSAMQATVDKKLKGIDLKWSNQFCAGVVLASEGYPGNYKKGEKIVGLEDGSRSKDILVFEAGTKEVGDSRVTSGGRVLIVEGLGSSITEATNRAYGQIATPEQMKSGQIPFGKICFLGAHYRTDIGQRGQPRY